MIRSSRNSSGGNGIGWAGWCVALLLTAISAYGANLFVYDFNPHTNKLDKVGVYGNSTTLQNALNNGLNGKLDKSTFNAYTSIDRVTSAQFSAYTSIDRSGGGGDISNARFAAYSSGQAAIDADQDSNINARLPSSTFTAYTTLDRMTSAEVAATYQAVAYQKEYLVDFDDGISFWHWMIQNPGVNPFDPDYGEPNLLWMKNLNDLYGTKFLMPLFYKGDGTRKPADIELSQVPTTWKAAFEAVADWLKFTFHSWSYPTFYVGSDSALDWVTRIHPTYTTNRNLFDDYSTCRTVAIQKFGNSTWTDEIGYVHIVGGDLPSMRKIRDTYAGGERTWFTLDDRLWNNREYEYYFEGTALDSFHTIAKRDGMYLEESEKFMFLATDFLPDDIVGTYPTFAEYIATNPQTNAELGNLLIQSHEDYLPNGIYESATVRQWLTDAIVWADSNGYVPRFPTYDRLKDEAVDNSRTAKKSIFNGYTTVQVTDGGTGATTQQAAINTLTNVAAATNEYVLTKDTATGNAIFKPSVGGEATLPSGTAGDLLVNVSGTTWDDTSKISFNDTTGVLTVADSGAVVLNGTTPIGLTNPDALADMAQLAVYAPSGTNVGASLQAIPRGSGKSATSKSQIDVFNTDYAADSTNYEHVQLKAAGSRYILGISAAGTGQLKPLSMTAGSSVGLTVAPNACVYVGAYDPASPPTCSAQGNLTVTDTISSTGLKIDHPSAADGYVWTATDADGNGQWKAAASSFVVKVVAPGGTIASGDNAVFLTNSGGTTITRLPDYPSVDGFSIYVRNMNANAQTIAPLNAGQKMNFVTDGSYSIPSGKGAHFKYLAGDYASWYVMDDGNYASDLTLPGSSTDTAIARWSGTGGNSLLSSSITSDGNTITLPASTGKLITSATTGEGMHLYNIDFSDNFAIIGMYPTTGTNVSAQLHVIPKGTGYNANNKAKLSLYSTDYVADSTNYSRLSIAPKAASHDIVSEIGGTGTLLPVRFLFGATPTVIAPITGGLQVATGTRPTCDSASRFTFFTVAGGAGVKDTVEVCAKAADDNYAWRTIY